MSVQSSTVIITEIANNPTPTEYYVIFKKQEKQEIKKVHL